MRLETGEERRRCLRVCVCVRQADTGGQRRRFGTFGEERSLVAERRAPGCGNIRLQTTDQRRALLPGRGAPGTHTHTHTAPAVTHSLPGRCGWVDCFCRDREREQFAVSVCQCVHMRHMSQLFIKTPARFNTSMTIFADNYRKNTSGRKSSKFKV